MATVLPLDSISLAVYAVAVLLIIIFSFLIRLELKFRRLLMGKNAHSLEGSLTAVSADLQEFKRFTKDMEQYLKTVETRLKNSIQQVETVRYNPFKGTGSGGNNSFSTAILSEKGDGVVLTSMYARDRISMFAKPVKAFASEYELSEEEHEAITTCKKNLTTP